MKKTETRTLAFLVIGLMMVTACNEKIVTEQNNSNDTFLSLSDNSSDIVIGFTLSTYWNPGPQNKGNGHHYVSSKNNDGHLLAINVNKKGALLPIQTLDNSIEYRNQKLQIADLFGSTNRVNVQHNEEVGLISDVEVDLNFPASLEVEPLSEISKSGSKMIRWKKLSTDEDLVCRISYNTLSNLTKTTKNFVVSGKDGEFSIPLNLLNECEINKTIDIKLGRWNETSFNSGISGTLYAISYTEGRIKVVE
jgi:hypothetical protein